MLLQELVEYSRRPDVDIAPPMYEALPIRYWIDLDREGGFEGITTVEAEDGKRPKAVPVPSLVRASSVKPRLLADNAEYVLGIGRDANKAGRVKACHEAFVHLTRRCEAATGEQSVRAVLHFLETCSSIDLRLPEDFDPGQWMSFRVEREAPVGLPRVQSFWVESASEGRALECLVCGHRRPAMERIQAKLKGIPGGQMAGLALISANANAFESYGLAASYVAPTCQECSDRFMKAANHLLRDPNGHLRIGNAVYIFWTRTPSSFSPIAMLQDPHADEVRQLLLSTFQGRVIDLDPTPFFATCISASGARAVIRDWIDTTVGRAERELAGFFQRQLIVDAFDEPARPLGIFALGKALVRSNSQDNPPKWVYDALIRAALVGGTLPATLLFKAVERCRLERGVNHQRAALIKMVLFPQPTPPMQQGEQQMVQLDPDNADPAYLCGRLFAELEAVQRAALGEVGATIVDRYYGTASSAPATVFGRLLRGAQPHLGKLRRDRPGSYHALDRRLQAILDPLGRFPSTLTLEQQGLFALGYYHQRAADTRDRVQHKSKAGHVDDDTAASTELVNTILFDEDDER